MRVPDKLVHLTSKDLALVIKQHYQPGDRVVVNGIHENSSSVNFYSGIQLSVLNGYFGNLWFGSYFDDASRIFLDDASFRKLWDSDQRVFFLCRADEPQTFSARDPGFRYDILIESGGKKVLVNRQHAGGHGGGPPRDHPS